MYKRQVTSWPLCFDKYYYGHCTNIFYCVTYVEEYSAILRYIHTLMSMVMSTRSLPSQTSKGSSSCNLCDFGSTSTLRLMPSDGGAWYVSTPGSNPLTGSSGPNGSLSLNSLPITFYHVSLNGSMRCHTPCSLKMYTYWSYIRSCLLYTSRCV